MDKSQIITSFVLNRPEAVGIYGYGSGVFKQEGYSEAEKPQIDIIFLVDDLKEWHYENMEKNPNDYSMLGKLHIYRSSIDKLKGNNKITYYSHIYENGYRFKYGVMEEVDFLSSLNSWGNFFIAGRFQKPVLKIKGNEIEDKAIDYNRKQAMLVAAMLSGNKVTKQEFYKNICALSYNGALRMQIAENPHKVENIVNGCYDRFKNLYKFDVDYIKEIDSETIQINHMKAVRHANELPIGLLVYLYTEGYDITNIFDLRTGINYYLSEHNKREELSQSIDTFKTNGIVRSTPYLFAKVKKRVIGK